MAKTKHYRGTVNLLKPFFTNRPQQFKIKIAEGYIYVENNNYIYWNGKIFQQLEQLDEKEGAEVFIYTEENRFLLEEFIPEENVPDREWVVEPVEVKTEEGETVGAVGVVADEVSKMRVVLFMSADGTTAPITFYTGGDEVEKNLARQDLKSLSEVLILISNKLADD